MMRIFYFPHAGESLKDPFRLFLQKEFGAMPVDYHPLNMKAGFEAVTDVMGGQPDMIIGRGLGGFYALRNLERNKVRTLLVNPVFTPSISLLRHVGIGFRNQDTNVHMPFSHLDYESFKDPVPDRFRTFARNAQCVLALEGSRQQRLKTLQDYAESTGIPCTVFPKDTLVANTVKEHFRGMLLSSK